MRISPGHRWNLSPREAIELQARLHERLLYSPAPDPIRRIAGIDVGFEHAGTVARAAVVVLSFPDLVVLDCALAREPTRFPYVPGLLSFREIPVILKALRKIRIVPDVLLCDGQGYAHPRRFGLACHLGLIADLPSIGVAKTRLVGTHGSVPTHRGRWVPLMDGADTIGAVLRTRTGVKPVYVSVGHRMNLPTATSLTLACTTRYRLPETTRFAHRLASSPASVSARLQRELRANAPAGLQSGAGSL